MLLDLKRQLKDGETVPLTLDIVTGKDKHSTVLVNATVRPIATAAPAHKPAAAAAHKPAARRPTSTDQRPAAPRRSASPEPTTVREMRGSP